MELDFLYRVDWKIVPNPETLVDYYRGLVERSADYEIEAESGSEITSEDEEEDEEDEIDNGDDDIRVKSEPNIKTEEATETKWKEWMDDVSTKRSGEEGDAKGL